MTRRIRFSALAKDRILDDVVTQTAPCENGVGLRSRAYLSPHQPSTGPAKSSTSLSIFRRLLPTRDHPGRHDPLASEMDSSRQNPGPRLDWHTLDRWIPEQHAHRYTSFCRCSGLAVLSGPPEEYVPRSFRCRAADRGNRRDVNQ